VTGVEGCRDDFKVDGRGAEIPRDDFEVASKGVEGWLGELGVFVRGFAGLGRVKCLR